VACFKMLFVEGEGVLQGYSERKNIKGALLQEV
jgi:hypothetical protein